MDSGATSLSLWRVAWPTCTSASTAGPVGTEVWPSPTSPKRLWHARPIKAYCRGSRCGTTGTFAIGALGVGLGRQGWGCGDGGLQEAGGGVTPYRCHYGSLFPLGVSIVKIGGGLAPLHVKIGGGLAPHTCPSSRFADACTPLMCPSSRLAGACTPTCVHRQDWRRLAPPRVSIVKDGGGLAPRMCPLSRFA